MMSVRLSDMDADDASSLPPKSAWYDRALATATRLLAFTLAAVVLAGRIVSSRDSFRVGLGRTSFLSSKNSSGGGRSHSADDSSVTATALQCHSITIDSGSAAAPPAPIVPDGYDLVQATVHMRHLDRWMYRHDLIGNVCWAGQVNSTHPVMMEQCGYNLSSVWETFEMTSDPYARPVRGGCNAKQLTMQGRRHAEILGRAYGDMFSVERRKSMCESGRGGIILEAHEEQKNQLSAQHVYRGVCGKLPDAGEFRAETVLDRGIVERGRPFYLHLGLCGSEFLEESLHEASRDFVNENEARLRNMTGHLAMISEKSALEEVTNFVPFLDNEIDCYFSHACHGLRDFPSTFDDVIKDINELETLSRTYMFDYVEANGEEGEDGQYRRFVSNYFGYYFATVLRRMHLSLDEPEIQDGSISSLYVQVTTDQIVSTLLRILGAPRSMIRRRPPWGSQVIFQLLRSQATANAGGGGQAEKESSHLVRILYEGRVIRMQPLKAFAAFVEIITPSESDCSVFHDNFG